jgi:tetratricopeptide (TPR) repeat protein
LGESHPETLGLQRDLAGALFAEGRAEDAAGLLRAAIDGLDEALGADYPTAAEDLRLWTAVQVARSQARHAPVLPGGGGAGTAGTAVRGAGGRGPSAGTGARPAAGEPADARAFLGLALEGISNSESGSHREARALLEAAVEGLGRLLGPGQQDTLTAKEGLARCILNSVVDSRSPGRPPGPEDRRELGRARALLEEILAAAEGRPEPPGNASSARGALATVLSWLEEHGAAAGLMARRVREEEEAGAPEERILSLKAELGWELLRAGDPSAARPPLAEALEGRRRLLGAGHVDTIVSMRALAEALARLDDPAASRRLLEEALERLAGLVDGQGPPGRAEEEAGGGRDGRLPALEAEIRAMLCRVLDELDEHDATEAVLGCAARRLLPWIEGGHPHALEAAYCLVDALRDGGDTEGARRLADAVDRARAAPRRGGRHRA